MQRLGTFARALLLAGALAAVSACDEPQSGPEGDHDGGTTDAYGMGACTLPEGYVDNDLDCDDTSAAVHAGAEELCDAVDNDCDGDTDEGLANSCGG